MFGKGPMIFDENARGKKTLTSANQKKTRGNLPCDKTNDLSISANSPVENQQITLVTRENPVSVYGTEREWIFDQTNADSKNQVRGQELAKSRKSSCSMFGNLS